MIVSIIQEKVEASSLEEIAAETTGLWGFPKNARLKTKTLKKTYVNSLNPLANR